VLARLLEHANDRIDKLLPHHWRDHQAGFMRVQSRWGDWTLTLLGVADVPAFAQIRPHKE
jgi:hypothetical protein